MKLRFSGKQHVLLFLSLLSCPLCTDCAEVRLVGPTKCSGRVEVYHDGSWGTVCDDNWSQANSEVLCQEVNCGPPIESKNSAFFGEGENQIWLDDLKCFGNESSILACQHKEFGSHNCDHSEDAGIHCSDGLKLINGSNHCSGTLQVFHDGKWGVICNKDWDQNLSETLCKQLECGVPRKTEPTSNEYMGFNSSCPGNVKSISQCTLTKNSEVCQGVAVSCEGVKDIRLSNGTDRCSGRVEVFVNHRWGTVCDDDWDMKDAQVVCRAMDCGSALEAKSSAFFGKGQGDIWLDNVDCAGNESTILKCKHPPFGDQNCGHGEDAGVVCLSNIRLINGKTECSGQVDFYHDGKWSSALKSEWGVDETAVVCREMSCGEPVSFSGSTGGGGRVCTVKCTGKESSLADCSKKEYNQTMANVERASVVCTGNVKLSDGPNRCAGKVQVFRDGQWADVCSDSWDMNDANVICQQLNCGQVHKITTTSDTEQKSGILRINQTSCGGTEVSISACQIQFSNQTCNSTMVAGVVCTEGLVVRLVNGPDRCSGRVELLHREEWGTLCDSAWTKSKANQVCDLLECGHTVDAVQGGKYPPGNGSVFDASESCFSDITSLHQCSLNGFKASSCSHEKDAGIICGGDSSIRLVSGTDRCSGRVEILHNARWGTVCDDDWDMRDAQVICQSKDCGSAIAAVPGAFFGPGIDTIWLDDVNCLGNESSLGECNHPPFGENNCGHGEDAGVICSTHIRLVNGTHRCSGNLEVMHDGQWLPALNKNWGMNEAAVVCSEMNCGDPMLGSGQFPQYEQQKGYKVSCTGRESSLTQCRIMEYTRTRTDVLRHASVTCSGNVRLIDGPNRCAGRAEVFHKGKWGNVCGESWDMNDATVACQQLGCGKAYKITTAPDYGNGTGFFWVEHIECGGQESRLEQCRYKLGRENCNTSLVAGVVCADSMNIRLVDGHDRCSGRVEVRNGNVWGPVCNADWTLNKAETVCELLECGHAVNVTGIAHPRTGLVYHPQGSCFRTVENLQQCLRTGLRATMCAQDMDASVVCAAVIRLVGGSNACSGRVEVMHKGEWGTVCDDDWDMSDAKVVCRQLGCGLPTTVHTSSSFGRGTGPTWLDNVDCRGTESVLTQCTHNGFGKHNCGHDEDAGVTCLDTLQKPQINLSPGPEVNWGDRVEITCTITESGGTFKLRKTNETFAKEMYSKNEAGTFTFLKADFSQNGLYYCEYSKNISRQVVHYPQGDAVELRVTVRLDHASISVTSLHPMLITSPEKVSVSRGESFNITCTVKPTYPGGFFYLTRSNVTVSEVKRSVHQSNLEVAVFEITYVQYQHQGNYTCVYGVNISSRTFQAAPSQAIEVTVVASVSNSVALVVVIVLLLLVFVAAAGYVVWKKRRWSADNMVRFVNRLGGALQDIRTNESTGVPHSFSNEDTDMDGFEDPPGTVYHDHEPLVYTRK